MSGKFTFTKDERLKSRRLSAVYSAADNPTPPIRYESCGAKWRNRKVIFSSKRGFSVPKKRFKTAVERNLLKRRMREAYRMKKHKFYRKLESSENSLAIMLIYTGKHAAKFEEIEKAMGKITWRLGKIADADWQNKGMTQKE